MPKPDTRHATFGRAYRIRQHQVERKTLRKRMRRDPRPSDPATWASFEFGYALREDGQVWAKVKERIMRAFSALAHQTVVTEGDDQ